MIFRSAFTTMALALVAMTTVHASPVANPSKLAERGLFFKGGINDFNCKPRAPHPNPVILVHGLGAPIGIGNFAYMAPRFAAKGYCAFTLDYGHVPELPLFGGFGSVQDSSQELSDLVDKVLAATGAAKVDIVGHSEGSCMPRYYLKYLGGNLKVDRFVGIGANSYGTTLTGLLPLLQKLGLYDTVKKVVSPICRACFQLTVGAPFLDELNAGGDTVPGVKYMMLVSKFDEFVNPYTNGYLRDQNPNLKNVLLQDLCAVDVTEHIGQAFSPIVFNAVHSFLTPSADQTVNCLDAFN